ncbi:MAG: carbohydrate ABC transporter permease [Firmicutes bacterium]|nr:carbohydrate ABC transporter permease [Bacillota bacterium]
MQNFKKSIGEKIFGVSNYTFLILLSIITIYPFYYVLCASLSDSYAVLAKGGLMLYPVGFNVGAYALVFLNNNIVVGYANTLFYVFAGVSLNIILTMFAAYCLSRRTMPFKRFFMLMITFTMYFSGGLIPNYLLVKSLGLLNSRLALILPGAVATWNVIILRTYMLSIPNSMEEAARIDSANDLNILFRIIAPISIPAIAVNILFYAVGHWNSWFPAMIYLQDKNKFPLQLFLRQILIQADVSDMADYATEPIAENIKYATIIVSIIPILFVFPFLQRFFVTGMMVGAIKE